MDMGFHIFLKNQFTTDFLALEGVATHSFRKGYATNIYVNNNYNIKLVRILLQHSGVVVSQRYIGRGSKQLENALAKNEKLILRSNNPM